MSIRITDEGGGMERFRARLRRLESDGWRDELYERIGKRLHELVQEGWQKRADPYGNAWAPTQQPNPILEDSGAMRASTGYTVDSHGITLTVADFKAAFHQHGTSRGIVPRRMLPEETLPPAWLDEIKRIVDAFFDETFGRG